MGSSGWGGCGSTSGVSLSGPPGSCIRAEFVANFIRSGVKAHNRLLTFYSETYLAGVVGGEVCGERVVWFGGGGAGRHGFLRFFFDGGQVGERQAASLAVRVALKCSSSSVEEEPLVEVRPQLEACCSGWPRAAHQSCVPGQRQRPDDGHLVVLFRQKSSIGSLN